MADAPILARLTGQLTAQGLLDPRELALERLRHYGIIDAAGDLTAYGRIRDRMSPAARAIDRQARRSGRDRSEYRYTAATNRATLRRR